MARLATKQENTAITHATARAGCLIRVDKTGVEAPVSNIARPVEKIKVRKRANTVIPLKGCRLLDPAPRREELSPSYNALRQVVVKGLTYVLRARQTQVYEPLLVQILTYR